MGFDEARMSKARFERTQDWIESLDVPDLKNQPIARSQLCQLSGMLRIFRDRLFHEKMFTLLQKWKRDFVMRIYRSVNRHGVDYTGKFVVRFLQNRVKFLR